MLVTMPRRIVITFVNREIKIVRRQGKDDGRGVPWLDYGEGYALYDTRRNEVLYIIATKFECGHTHLLQGHYQIEIRLLST